MGDLLGYARVSTIEQKAHLQTDALKAAGCIRIWTDKASGALDHRPKLDQVLDHLRPGDTLVVWRLDASRPEPAPPDRDRHRPPRPRGGVRVPD